MKKKVVLLFIWCTCISLWIIVWVSGRRHTKPVNIVFREDKPVQDNAETEQKIPQTLETPFQGTAKLDACININTSDMEQLCLLPGVGPGLAEKIITFRQESGTFKGVEDLLKIKGIGAAKLEKFQKKICF